MNMRILLCRLCGSNISWLTGALLLAMAHVTPVYAGEFVDAVRQGDLEKVKELLKTNPDLVFDKDEFGATPLHWAASEGHKEVAELLLANKADVNAKPERFS